jgi:hypothetical protein
VQQLQKWQSNGHDRVFLAVTTHQIGIMAAYRLPVSRHELIPVY